MKSFNGFEFLHHNKTWPNNTNYSKEENTIQNKIQLKTIRISERQHHFQRHKIVPGEQPYGEATNPRVYNSNNIIVFSDSIASFKRNIKLHFNNQLKEGRARFKYFPAATSNDPLFYIEPTWGRSI